MKISQLVATKTKIPYYESVASRLPRGIKTQQQLFKLGYKIAVEDLGLAKAKTLNENFAAKLINSYHTQSLNEGIGSFLGKAAGHVAGAAGAAGRGLKGAWNDAKAGYAAAKGSWNPGTSGSETTPSPGGSTPTPPTAGTPPTTSSSAEDPKQLRAQAAELTQKADEIENQQAAPSGSGADDAAYAARYGNGPGQRPVFSRAPAATAVDPHSVPYDAPSGSGSNRPYVAPQSGRIEPTLNTPASSTPVSGTNASPTKPALNYSSGQLQAPAPGKVNYSRMPKAAPVPQATPSQGAYSVKNPVTPSTQTTPAPAAPQFKGPKVNGLQVRNMGESMKLKFRSNFLGIDL